jgi:hypothetical protein
LVRAGDGLRFPGTNVTQAAAPVGDGLLDDQKTGLYSAIPPTKSLTIFLFLVY